MVFFCLLKTKSFVYKILKILKIYYDKKYYKLQQKLTGDGVLSIIIKTKVYYYLPTYKEA